MPSAILASASLCPGKWRSLLHVYLPEDHPVAGSCLRLAAASPRVVIASSAHAALLA